MQLSVSSTDTSLVGKRDLRASAKARSRTSWIGQTPKNLGRPHDDRLIPVQSATGLSPKSTITGHHVDSVQSRQDIAMAVAGETDIESAQALSREPKTVALEQLTMVTATTTIRHSNFRFEHFFFSGMALFILACVFVGFAHTYYLAGVFNAPLPNLLVRFHGAVFTTWILLLVTQTSLVAAHRVDIHRRLGLFGFGLACVMVVLGLLAATDSIIRHATNSEMAAKMRTFYATPLAAMLMFSTLIYFAFRNRFNPAAHKRLILIANLAIVDAALDRWPVLWDWWDNRMANLMVVLPNPVAVDGVRLVVH
jgi:hypothetical protein